MPWTIYCHTHVESGRRYVGLTKYTMMHRWNQHCAQAKSSKGGRWHFPNAIRKYGKNAFSHEVLEICSSIQEANASEERWILHFDTRNTEKGFNLAKGGDHVPHPIRRNPWDDPEFRERAILSSRQTWSDPIRRAKASSTQKAIFSDPAYAAKKSMQGKKQWSDPESRPRQIEAVKKKASSLEFRSKCRSLWDDPSFRSRSSAPLLARNKAESSKTHCKYGHEYTPENTFRSGKGRNCRSCRKIRQKSKKTHCPNGHELSPGNFYLNKQGHRLCRICDSRPVNTFCKKGHGYGENSMTYKNGHRKCHVCLKIRQTKQLLLNKTHCSNGHELTKENVYVNKQGARLCFTCKSFRLNKTHCLNGHELTKENTNIHKDGRRRCRICVNSYQRNRRRLPSVSLIESWPDKGPRVRSRR